MSPKTTAPAATSASCCNAVLIVMDAKPTPFPCGLLRSHRRWSSASEAGMQWGLQESAKRHSGGGEQQPVLLQASGGVVCGEVWGDSSLRVPHQPRISLDLEEGQDLEARML